MQYFSNRAYIFLSSRLFKVLPFPPLFWFRSNQSSGWNWIFWTILKHEHLRNIHVKLFWYRSISLGGEVVCRKMWTDGRRTVSDHKSSPQELRSQVILKIRGSCIMHEWNHSANMVHFAYNMSGSNLGFHILYFHIPVAERPPRERQVACSIPGRVILKTLKNGINGCPPWRSGLQV